ncbi:S9 family peptidase [Roseateles violae]|uniref:Prolyl oligopeptidase family serine peptidase n=1 Tax=Roseateles violae TaxID=3058042 RepID=A0ABT8DXY2_9BURK|nr:prolyl oligopeptidase family serine peptidase [Pelomonas sp. PFR6]MDN3921917.1 prolyl oligopeptidase family serine peptidase [Pelomonas sp. PFR6]
MFTIPHPPRLLKLGGIAALLLSLAAGVGAQQQAVVQPNANLFVQGIPAIPQSLADAVARYTDFRGHAFVDWHPSKREMLVSHRKAGANTAQLFRVSAPLAEPEQLTDGADPVSQASYEPREGRYVVFERSAGGSEVAQIYRLDDKDKAPVLLTNPDERHDIVGWLNNSSQLLYTAVPIDRTAQGGSRAQISTALWIIDPAKPETKRKIADLPGPGWGAARPSWDDKQVALIRYLSANESQVWLLDLESGKTRQILPAANEPNLKAVHFPGAFSRDNKAIHLVSDRFGEFRELMSYEIASGKLTRITADIRWDVSGAAVTEDGRKLAVQINVDGRDELHLFDGQSFKELPAPKLPAGNVGTARFHPKSNELVFSLNNAQGPSQIYTLGADGRSEAWTKPYAPPGVDPSKFAEQQIVRWKSFDGLTISGLLTRPDSKRFPGKRPVIISIHGGPEGQATVGFLARNQYYVNELGIAFLQPNVRGSEGYGKSFLAMDNGFKREDSVKDIGALLDWIATQPDLDASRVLVTGGSYGGYMTLAVSTHYADRIAGSVDIVGISHFVTFLQNTESYRRDLRRVEYGDERDPAMREHLDKISPLTNAAKIKKPLFVVQGKNDPRVPYTEAEQIVAKVREGGTPVWYLRAENEGHGFQKKENQDFQFYATILFMQQTLPK